jgi:hypothetical protein
LDAFNKPLDASDEKSEKLRESKMKHLAKHYHATRDAENLFVTLRESRQKNLSNHKRFT